MNNACDVLILGGGPAGLMAAIAAAERGAAAALLERNEKPGMKLRITGKGRCNVTNAAGLESLIAHVPVNGRFLFSAFSRFGAFDTIRFFESLGVPLKTERGGRVFPVSNNAHDIADALVKQLRRLGVAVIRGRAEQLQAADGRVRGVVTEKGEVYTARAVVVATGGCSYPKTGSTGDGYALARQAGHNIIAPKPSLVPLECHEGFCDRLMGLSLKNTALEVWDTHAQKMIYQDFGELLFTHFGVSGPLALSASSHIRNIQPGRCELRLDLKPALRPEQLSARLLRDFGENPNKNFINALNGLLPKTLVPVVVQLTKIPPGTKVNQITKEQRQTLVDQLKCLRLTVTGFRPLEEAIITSGGVDTREIDPATMQSKRLPGLFFAGEVIDADAYTGGYNLQIAWSTGRAAGAAAAEVCVCP
ncbi:MAG: NAD(P)/FAD-dependent oxidoreductase [Oscillospiraceae bacterium]|jgi:predicted Rossmann fold flavoprotein|nr:NAD(P)/FAD-dependent oxidoreductase [Oscillospiraceae bacterium]